MKTCNKCNETKPYTEFYKDSRGRDGYYRRCKACHNKATTERRKKNPERHREYIEKNKDRIREYQRVWQQGYRATEKGRQYRKDYYWKNRDRDLARSAEYHRANPDRTKEAWERWCERNADRLPDLRKSRNINRRARKLNAPGNATPAAIASRVSYFGYACYLCDGPYEAIDHVIPLARGGSNWPANLRPICGSCNSKKGAKLLKELGVAS